MLHVIAPHISCVVTEDKFDEALKASYTDIYIVRKDGKYLRHSKLSGGRFVRVQVKEIPGLKEGLKEVTPEVMEEVNFLPNGKIPHRLLEEIIQFFRDVMEIKKAEQEAMAHILFNQKDVEGLDKGYRIAIPNQIVSKASAKYQFDHIQPGDVIVVDIHSHNTMRAFFSGTDDSDDKKGIYYAMVAGQLKDKTPQLIARLNINEIRKEMSVDDIFESVKKEIKVPAEWLDKVQTVSPSNTGKQYPVAGWMGYRKHGRHTEKDRDRDDFFREALMGNYPDVYSDLYTEADLEADRRLANEGIFRPRDTEDEVLSGEIIVRADPTMDKREPRVIKVEDEPMDRLPLVGNEYDFHCAEYGKDVADAYEQMEIWLPELEGIDELLLNMISQAFMLMSTDGQMKISQNGIKGF